ncbi:DoxX family protein [Leptobacterium sp. I13]|uniref:DoxX family protein n=1 Tax=Leptobacterium meishanense TaxID=3128904 RepID=UPI0030EF8055
MVQRIIYWIVTGLISLLFLYSATIYFTNYERVEDFFQQYGYPTYIVYPLAVAKVLGIAVILINKWKALKEWAYAGFFFNLVLAFSAHYTYQDSIFTVSLALPLLLISYFLGKKVRS